MHKDRGTFCCYVGLFTSLRHSRRFTRACRTQRRTVCNRSLLLACRAGYMAARGSRVTAGSPLSLSLYPVLFLVLYLSLYITREQTRENRIPRCALSRSRCARSLSVSRRQCSRTRDRILCNNTPANVNIELYFRCLRALASPRDSLSNRALLSRARSIDREELLSQRAADIGVRQWRI